MRLLLSAFCTLFIALQVHAQGIDFFHGTWKEALEESAKTGKPIFVDAYAKWCGPCKRMARTTFMDKEAGDYYNANFINVKIDAEESEGIRFRKKYPVSAFPTLFYIDEKGEVLHKVVGGQDVANLIRNGEFALGKIDYSREYQVRYEEGERSPEFVYEYIKSLNKSGKSSLKVSNEYLRTQDDLTTEFNLQFIFEAAVEADSRIFKLLIEHKKAIGQLVGLQALKERVLLACENTALKAVEFEYRELLEEAKEKMKANYPEKSDAFAAKADLEFYKKVYDAEKYAEACEDYAKYVINGEADKLAELSREIQSNFSDHEACMKMAEKYAKEAANNGKQYTYYLNYANILLLNGKERQARKAAQEALELAKKEGERAQQEVNHFIRKLES